MFAIGVIAKRKVNTLILVHNKALLAQWKERLESFLNIDETIEVPETKRGRKRKLPPLVAYMQARTHCMA